MNSNKNSNKRGIYLYTLAFIAISMVVFSVFYLRNFSFVAQFDGVGQHYPMLVELRNIIIDRLKDPFAPINFWTWQLGIGSDVIHSMSYYGLGDVISYLIVLFPEQYLEFGYGFLMILRMYLAGMTMIFYLKKYKYSSVVNAASGIFYAFCGTLLMFVHPFFANPLILLPLLLKSIDRVFEGKSIKSFAWLVAYTFINNFYFAYMLVIMVIFYFFLNYILIFKQKVNFWNVFIKLGVNSVIGAMISCVLFLPSIIGTLNSTRAERPFANGIVFYPLDYYLKLLKGFIGPVNHLPYSTKLSFASIVIFAVVFTFLNRKKYRVLFASLVSSLIILVLPYGAALMNGFTSPANRWAFGLAFVLTICVAHFLNEIKDVTIKEIKIYTTTYLVFLALHWVHAGYNVYSLNMMWPLVFLTINLILIVFCYIQRKEKLFSINLVTLFFLIICLNVAVTGNYYFSNKGDGVASNRRQGNTISESIEDQYYGLNKMINDESFYRTSPLAKGATYNLEEVNNSMLRNNREVASYLSVQNKNIGQFSREMKNNQFTMTNPLKQLDDRTVLMNYLGVKYLFVEESEGDRVPFLYKKDIENPKASLYSTDYALPIAFMNYNEISQESYEELSANQKEDYLIQGIVTDRTKDSSSEIQNIAEYENIDFNISDITDNKLEISNDKKQYRITIKRPEDLVDREVYLKIKGLKYIPYSFTERWEDVKKNRVPRRTTYDFFKNNIGAHYSDGYEISFTTDQKKNTIKQYTKYDPSSYDPQEDFLINLGIHREELSSILIESNSLGFYTFESMELISKSFNEEYETQIRQLKDQSLKQIKFSNNQLEGNIQNNQDGYLVTSIPYSSGWEIYVNDELVESEKANIGFLSVYLEEGSHQVKFVYHSPGFKIGLIISIIGILFWVLLLLKPITNRKKTVAEGDSKK